MAEICCGLVSGSEASTASCEPSPRSARRRRMEIRRFRFVSGADANPPPSEPIGKRQRLDSSASPPAILQTESCIRERGTGAGNDSSSSSNSNSNPSSDLPPTASAESAIADQCPRYGITSVCGRRRDMEDAVSVQPTFLRRDHQIAGGFHFFGVYDGHGCSHVAVSCKDRMHEMVAEELKKFGSSPPPSLEWKEMMKRSFLRMDTEVVGWSSVPQNVNCRCELQTPKCDHVGSTAVVAVVSGDRIVVSNCGDSRAVLCRKGLPIPLSSDHKPDRPDELQRIQEAGGRVIYWDGARVLGVLAMSRAIGDNYLKPYVISEPEVTVTERTDDDECLILASDGLWDVVTNAMACNIVRMCLRGNAPGRRGGDAVERVDSSDIGSDKACSDAAMLLTKLALARQSSDNVSVVVIDLRRKL